ncbi:helix-turn-helix transcriptional regulator [Yoonia sp. 2307UL14-13]|uniref:helix-turn-helix transcriptional regulator n=1 Tax=Yoonia sp. 2307UL14-13 TaxID=3126506 RepID=UPI0030AD74EA
MKITHILRGGGLHKAVDLAAQTNVSPRTIYRDMETLIASGLPVLGERGTGYRVEETVTLPPMHLTTIELEALQLGLSAVAQGADSELSSIASALATKLDAIMPDDPATLAVPPFASAAQALRFLPTIRQAIRARQKLDIRSGDGRLIARPLKLMFWGRLWTCIVWNETDGCFADLRLDDMAEIQVLPGLFVDEGGKTLHDFRKLEGAAKANSQ